MNLNESILDLLKNQNVRNVVIALDEKGHLFMQARQTVSPGVIGDTVDIGHQVKEESVTACVQVLTERVTHINELQTKILRVRREGN